VRGWNARYRLPDDSFPGGERCWRSYNAIAAISISSTCPTRSFSRMGVLVVKRKQFAAYSRVVPLSLWRSAGCVTCCRGSILALAAVVFVPLCALPFTHAHHFARLRTGRSTYGRGRVATPTINHFGTRRAACETAASCGAAPRHCCHGKKTHGSEEKARLFFSPRHSPLTRGATGWLNTRR